MLHDKLDSRLNMGAIMDFLIKQHAPFLIATHIAYYDLKFDQLDLKLFEAVLTMITTVCLPAFLVYITCVMVKNRGSITSPEFKKRYPFLIEGPINTDTTMGAYWNVYVIYRWNATVLILVHLRDYCVY